MRSPMTGEYTRLGSATPHVYGGGASKVWSVVALIQPMSQNAAMRTDLPNFATKQDLADLRLEIAERDASIYRWMVYGALFVNAALIAIFVKLLS